MSHIPSAHSPLYRIGAVSKLTGIPVSTLRIWQTRYSAFTPIKTQGNQRLFGEQDVSKALLLKQLSEAGHGIGSIAHLELVQLRQLRHPGHEGAAQRVPVQPVCLAVVGLGLANRIESRQFAAVLSQNRIQVTDVLEELPVAHNATLSDKPQVLLIKVTRLGDHLGATTGFVLVFYDVTQVVSQEAPATTEVTAPVNLRLNRIPMVANHKVAFVDTQDVLCLESQAHYTRVLAHDGFHFCNLSIGDLQARLDPAQFMRIHRCFIVNLRAVAELGREGSKTHVVLKGKHREPIPVSRSEVGKLREALGLLARH